MALASVADYETFTGRTVAPEEMARVQMLLDGASARIVAYVGRDFALASHTERLRVSGGRIALSSGPVSAVDSVTTEAGAALDWTWTSGRMVDVETSYGYCGIVEVTYTAGYAEVPADVIAVVCQMAARAFGTAPEQTGLSQESIMSYSYSVGGAAASGSVGMLAGEMATLNHYRLGGGGSRSVRLRSWL